MGKRGQKKQAEVDEIREEECKKKQQLQFNDDKWIDGNAKDHFTTCIENFRHNIMDNTLTFLGGQKCWNVKNDMLVKAYENPWSTSDGDKSLLATRTKDQKQKCENTMGKIFRPN